MSNCTLYPSPGDSASSSAQSDELMRTFEFCLHTLNFLFGVPTNSYILWLIITGSRRGIAPEFFVLNLSVCELLFCLSVFIRIFDRWVVSIGILKNFLLGLANTGRPMFQGLMCVERYLAVVHPVTFLKYKPLRYRLVCCTLAWIIVLGSCLFIMLTLMSCYFYVYVFFLSVQLLLFVSIQLFCLVAVLRSLKQSGKKEEENGTKRRAFYIILITTVSTSIIYIPYTITGLFYISTLTFFRETFTIGFLCFVLAGFVQPILYLNRVGKLSCYKTHLVFGK